MSTWTRPAWVGVVGGVLLFGLLLVPVVLFQVRRHGALNARRLVGAAAAVAVPFTRGGRGLSGVVSGAVVRDVRGKAPAGGQIDRPSPSSTP